MIIEPNKYYNMSEQDKDFYMTQVKQFIKTNELFKQMENIVKRHVKAYHQDFYIHDIHSIVNHNNSDFVWMVRKTGTDLIIKNGHCISDEGNWTGKLWFNAIRDRNEHYYYYNTKTNRLTKITSDKAAEIVEKFNEYNLNRAS